MPNSNPRSIQVGSVDNTLLATVYNTDGSIKADLAHNTTGISIFVQRIGEANGSALTLSAKATPQTTHADGAFLNLGGGDISVDCPDAPFATYKGRARIYGTFDGGTIIGEWFDVVGFDAAAVAVGANTTTPANGDIAAIKAKTDNLPNDPAGVSDVSPSIDFAPEITINPTELSSGSVDLIRDGLATLAKQDEILGAIGDIECGGGGGLTGDYTLTVTVTDADTSQPIENATVTLSRTGERGAELTDVNGVAVVGLDAATWSWIVRAAGYESRTGTVVVTGDQALSVEMDGIVQPEPPEPAEAPLCAVTLPVINQYGVRLSGVSVGFKFAGLQPNADPGAVIMSPPPPQVSDGNGVVQVNLIRLARYTATYKIEGETRNIAIAVPDEGSFIVVDT
jgi:hypothetical protein